jgi:hypothetical protein
MFWSKATIAALGASLVLTGLAQAKDTFIAKMTGDQEVPPVTTDTTGRFEIQFNKNAMAAEFTLRLSDGVRVTQAHLHCGQAGANGPVVVFLAGFHGQGWDVDGKWVSNATVTDENIVDTTCGATLAALLEFIRAGNVYVNAHSRANPGGEVRGQLEADE